MQVNKFSMLKFCVNSPSRIYNVDKIGISLDGHAPRIIALKGHKKVRTIKNFWLQKSSYSVIAWISASGLVMSTKESSSRSNEDGRKVG